MTPIYIEIYSKAKRSSIDAPRRLGISGVVYSNLPFIVSELKAFASIFNFEVGGINLQLGLGPAQYPVMGATA